LADEENQMVIITKTQNESGLQGGNKSDQIVEKRYSTYHGGGDGGIFNGMRRR